MATHGWSGIGCMVVVAASCGYPPPDAPADGLLPPDTAPHTFAQQAYIKASNTDPGDKLGYSLALSSDGKTLAIGAVYEDSGATGMGGNQARNDVPNSGAVYVLARADTMSPWSQPIYIKPSNTGADDYFGASIALSDDGSTLAVGAVREASAATGVGGIQADDSAPESGAVYVFTRAGATWTQEAYLKASNTSIDESFGSSLALSADGRTLAVGAVNEGSNGRGVNGTQHIRTALGSSSGAVYVFTRSGTTWAQQAYVKASDSHAGINFGLSVAVSADGSTLAVGMDDSNDPGTVYVFTRAGTIWNERAFVRAPTELRDQFGASVALSGDGSILAVGAPFEASAATGVGGNHADNSAPKSGAAYVFAGAGATWTQRAYIKASNTGADDQFGGKVALSSDGSTLAVGAQLEASAAAGVGGNQADDSVPRSGAVYVFEPAGTTWMQRHYVKASNTGMEDRFGSSVTVSGDGSILVVGASGEASAATGVGGDQANDLASTSGAAYVFQGAL